MENNAKIDPKQLPVLEAYHQGKTVEEISQTVHELEQLSTIGSRSIRRERFLENQELKQRRKRGYMQQR